MMRTVLDYEASILVDLHQDSLLVLADGLDVEFITYMALKLHADPHNLLIVCNYRVPEARVMINMLEKDGVMHLPSIINADVSNKERETIYKRGGVVFVSSRILVVDLLMQRMPVSLVSGVLVLRVHELQEACQDSFAIRLLRERNSQIHIKAITDNAVSLTSGYNHAERIMMQLGISKLTLWPRFNLQVISCLNEIQPQVEEVRVKMTSNMSACQSYLLDLIKASLKELLSQNPSLSTDELTLEKALLPNFDKIISLHIDPLWNQLNHTSRNLVADIANLRCLLRKLIDGDSIHFLNSLEDFRQSASSSMSMTISDEHASGSGKRNWRSCPSWLLLEQADRLLSSARSRVFSDYTKKFMKIELNPKWKTLMDILKDIYCKYRNRPVEKTNTTKPITVLILITRASTARMVEHFLNRGFQSVRRFLMSGFKEAVSTTSCKPCKASKQQNTLTQIYKTGDSSHDLSDNTEGDDSSSSTESDSKELSTDSLTTPLPIGCSRVHLGSRLLKYLGVTNNQPIIEVIIRVAPTISGDEDSPFIGANNSDKLFDETSYRLSHILNIIKPNFVVLYEPKVGWVRELEVYHARSYVQSTTKSVDHIDGANPTYYPQLTVYFVLYENSVEEQRYLTSLRKEKEAFEALIKLSSTIVIPKDSAQPVLTGSDLERQPLVIVDMREFRSELPALLYRKGIKIQPFTLSVADYILAPHICIERKSVSDLIGSLNSGRLYQQCTAMSRHYLNPVLLIEFTMPTKCATGYGRKYGVNEGVGFSLYTGKHAIIPSSELNSRHLLAKIVLLTIHFPNLRLFWSMTPYCTAELFAEIKLGRAEPTLDKLPQDGNHLEDHNVEAVDMLLKLPGITWKNYRRVMANVTSLHELTCCDLERLVEILDNSECALKLYNFLHAKFSASDNQAINCDSETNPNSISSAKTRPKLSLASRVKTRRGKGRMISHV